MNKSVHESLPEYLKRQLIAYIGNKRSLQPFLGALFSELMESENRTNGVFLDPFAGSGAVSRLARYLGFEVHANDWEIYAWVMNQAFLTLRPKDLDRLFRNRGGFAKVLAELNSLKAPKGEEYFARYYAPRATQDADYKTERLFYTRDNALFIDAVRERIEEWFPGNPGDDGEAQAKNLLLALLVYEASVHSNTNGVFKAYHKGFGGHGGEALTRILAPMVLEKPELWESVRPAFVGFDDAARFVKSRPADICYLDPPYNQHQYGSNYHLLNSVALWDRPIYGHQTGGDGRLVNKAGIRHDWVRTKSSFCVKGAVAGAFAEILDAIDARWVVVSYNTEGLFPFPDLFALLETQGEVDLRIQDYVTYRGGRQSPSRQNHNLELVLVLDRKRKATHAQRERMHRFLAEKKLGTLLRASFHPQRLRETFPGEGFELELPVGRVRTSCLYRLTDFPDCTEVSTKCLEELTEQFGRAACQSHAEEADILIDLLDRDDAVPEQRVFEKRLLSVLRKFAFAKYKNEIGKAIERCRDLAKRRYLTKLDKGLDELEELAKRRIEG